jgi:hypothetical protein
MPLRPLGWLEQRCRGRVQCAYGLLEPEGLIFETDPMQFAYEFHPFRVFLVRQQHVSVKLHGIPSSEFERFPSFSYFSQ